MVGQFGLDAGWAVDLSCGHGVLFVGQSGFACALGGAVAVIRANLVPLNVGSTIEGSDLNEVSLNVAQV